MFLPKYQRFVAWRYLLERDRELSGAILAVVGFCLWLAFGLGAACLWYPLADVSKVPPPNPPTWASVALGLSFAAPLVAWLAVVVTAMRGKSCRGAILLGLHWLLVSWAAFGVFHEGGTESGLSTVDYMVAALLFHVAFVLPATVRVLGAWRSSRVVASGLFGLAIMGTGVLAVLWLPLRRLLGMRRSRSLLWIAFVLQGVVLEVILLTGAYLGMRSSIWPLLSEAGVAAPVSRLVAATAIVAVLALTAYFVLARGQRKTAMLTLGLGAVLQALCLATVQVFLAGVHEVGVNLDFLGGWSAYTPPMELIIPALVAGAIALLAGVLLSVRYAFTFFTMVSIGGVTIGTMALVIVLSVMSGFESDLREKILGFNAHIQITHVEELQFTGYRDLQKVLEETPGVVGHTPFLMTEAYMSNHNNYGNVTLKGIDPARVASVTEIVHNLVAGDERALEKIWPLSKDGSIAGKPSGESPKALDFDLDEGPIDFSGGAQTVPAPQPTNEDFEWDEPEDFSGGLDEYNDVLDDQVAEGDSEMPKLEMTDWNMPLPSHGFIRPEVAVLNGLLVGQELVNQISLYTDQEIRIISPLPDTSPDGLSIPRLQNFRIAGKFFSGMYEYDLKYVYCSLSALQDFLDLGDEVNGIEVRVKDPTQTGAIVRKLEAKLGPNYKVQDWKELNKALFSALKLEKIAMFFILVIIVLVASFSIVGNLIMVVIEKAKEIAILKTLGSSNRGVMKIFITQGFFIGLVGTSLGVALGLGACYLGMTFGVPLDPDVYYIDKLPIQIEPWSVVIVGCAGLAISVVATIYPAFIAARMRPVKGLRWD